MSSLSRVPSLLMSCAGPATIRCQSLILVMSAYRQRVVNP
jgi:hypothetical protein